MSKDDDSSGCGCGGFGCLSFFVLVFLMWALFFGVTIGDRRYDLNLFPPGIDIEELKR